MNSKSTLDQKYQRSRELGYIPRRTIYRSPVRSETTSQNKTSYTPKYRPAKYAEITRKDMIRNIDSPIKSISLLPYTPSKLQPTKLYKLFNDNTPANRGILINKNRKYDGKNRKMSTLDNNKGIFNRLRSFLVKFSLSGHEHDQTDLNTLRKSAKNILNVETPESKVNKRVWFKKDEQQETKRRETYSEEPRDFVEEAIVHKRQQFESEQTKNQLNELQELINIEREKNERLRDQHKDEIKILEETYDNRTEELNEQISVLQKRANLHVNDLEKSKSEQLEKELFKEHEKFLIKQKEQEEELSRERSRLQNLEHDLNSKRNKIEKDFAKLKKDRKTILTQKLEYSIQNRKLDELNEKNTQLMNSIKTDGLNSDDELLHILKLNQEKYKQEKKVLIEEKKTIKLDLELNENDYVQFFEKLIDISQSILNDGDAHKEYILKDFETLLESLNTKDIPRSLLIRFESIKNKFTEYLDAFRRFQLIYSRLLLQEIDEEYNIDNLKEVRVLFSRLNESFSKSMYKKRKSLYEMNEEISRFQIKLMSSSTSSQRCRDIARTYDKRSRILNEMKVLNELLISLSVLLKQLEDIIIIIGYSPSRTLNVSMLDMDMTEDYH